jgi:hypothetical protein
MLGKLAEQSIPSLQALHCRKLRWPTRSDNYPVLL